MALDPRQIILIAALVSWVLAGVVEFQAIKTKRESAYPGFMTLALLVNGLGVGLFSQRDHLHGLLTVGAANVLIMLAFSFFYMAIEDLLGDSPSLLVALLPPAMIAIMFPIIGFSDAMVVERVGVFTIVSFAACGTVAVTALRGFGRGQVRGPLMIAAAMLAITGIQVVRALRVIEKSRADLFANEAPQLVYHSAIVAAVIVTTLGYMAMAADAQKARQLQQGAVQSL